MHWKHSCGSMWKNFLRLRNPEICDRYEFFFQPFITINLFQKSHNAPVLYPTMPHFVTEMCTCVHISVTKWCIVGYLPDALWDLCDGAILQTEAADHTRKYYDDTKLSKQQVTLIGKYFWMCTGFISSLMSLHLALHLTSNMTASWHRTNFHITGPFAKEPTGHWWIPSQEASDANFLCWPDQAVEQTIMLAMLWETPSGSCDATVMKYSWISPGYISSLIHYNI